MFRRKQETEPKVEWVTSIPGLAETYPIIPARTALPAWFKASPTKISKDRAHGHGMGGHGAPPGPPPKQGGTVVAPAAYWRDESPTIRHCPGVVDVMRSGYLLRAWTDIEITTPEPPKGPDTCGKGRQEDGIFFHKSMIKGCMISY